LKEEALDRTMWRNRFRGGFGTVFRQNTEWWWWYEVRLCGGCIYSLYVDAVVVLAWYVILLKMISSCLPSMWN